MSPAEEFPGKWIIWTKTPQKHNIESDTESQWIYVSISLQRVEIIQECFTIDDKETR
jgi:hypothetical protein